MKILILAPYPLNEAPSQRFRFEHFLSALKANGHSYDFQSFLSAAGWQNLYSQGRPMLKLWAVLAGFGRRCTLPFWLHRYDVVYIHREITPLGPPVFEYIIGRIFKKKIIYDYDDAIWLPDQNQEPAIWKWLKWRSKVKNICRWSWKVTPGNSYLASYASKWAAHVEEIPTIIDPRVHHPIKKPSTNHGRLTIGWTGSHSTLIYLQQLLPVLHELETRHEFNFLVIANKNPNLPLKYFQYKKWQKQTEVKDLQTIDIGVMPLDNTEWSKGKCGFKLIQYLALGIPAVASPVGVNSDIVIHNETGYLAATHTEWVKYLTQLINDKNRRVSLGEQGRELVEKKYSTSSHEDKFLGLFQAN